MSRVTDHRGTFIFAQVAVRRALLRLAGALLVFSLASYVAISAYAADRFSHPIRQPVGQCRDSGLTCEDVQFPSTVDAVRLSGWFIDAAGPRTVLILHSRDGRRDDPTVGLMDIARAFHQHGYRLFMFDFRAHGRSGGERYSLGDWERRDVAGALVYLQGRGIRDVGVLGFSMGASTALRAAPAHPEMRALVLDSPFADLPALIDQHLTEVSGLPRLFTPGILLMAQGLYGMDLLENRPVQEMAALGARPILLIHSTTDDFTPVSQAYALRTAGAHDPNLQVWITTGPTHVRSFKQYPAEYLRRVTAFFDSALPSRNSTPAGRQSESGSANGRTPPGIGRTTDAPGPSGGYVEPIRLPPRRARGRPRRPTTTSSAKLPMPRRRTRVRIRASPLLVVRSRGGKVTTTIQLHRGGTPCTDTVSIGSVWSLCS